MKQKERVFQALANKQPDRVPLFEIWIDEDIYFYDFFLIISAIFFM